MNRRIALAAALSLGLAATAHAQSPTVQVKDAWARATASTAKVAGVFMTLTATGAPDKVVSATSPVAETVELHETVRDGNVMRMRPVPALVVTPGTPTELKPGGLHVMLIGLKRQLNRGETFPVTLTFEKAPPVTVTVTVQAAGASHGHGHGHGH
jgi:copper(I)-binding protein